MLLHEAFAQSGAPKGPAKTEIACELATLRKMQAALGEDRD
jgi:hypothetical protein